MLVDKFIKLLGDQKLWPPLNGYSPFFQGSEYNIKKYYGKYYSERVVFNLAVLINKNESQVYLPDGIFKLPPMEFFNRYLKNRLVLENVSRSFYESIAAVGAIYSENTYSEIKNKKFEEQMDICEKIRTLIWDANALVIFSVFFEKDFCWEIIEKSEFKITQEDFDAVWDEAIHPVEGSFDKQQLMHILNLFVEEKSWPEIIEECQYFYTSYHDAKNLVEVEKRLKEQFGHLKDKEVAQKELKRELEEEEGRKEKYAKWHNDLSENQKIIADYVQGIIIIRDRRKNFFNKGITIWWRVAQEMFREAGIPEKYIIYYTFREMQKGLEYLKENKEILMQREDGFFELIPYDEEMEMENLTPVEFARSKKILTDFYLRGHQIIDVSEIKGNIGAPGKINGKVRVIIDMNKGNDFKDGEILVTGMTRPEFVPLMKKAIAIITDEGGITCHAAIVSRELKKPCIIGTKIATQILKDGDLVEVDADKGIVKILK